MPEMRALRDLTGDYGSAGTRMFGGYSTVAGGSLFWCDEAKAVHLEERGLAERYYPPMSAKMEEPPENKMLAAPANKAIPVRGRPRKAAR